VAALVAELERIQLLRRLQANWHYTPVFIGLPRHHIAHADAIAQCDPQAADTALRAHVRQGLEKKLQGYGMKIG
jgi:DNA-binding GntR family transcriptional regulator